MSSLPDPDEELGSLEQPLVHRAGTSDEGVHRLAIVSYNSPAYQAALKLRGDGAVRDVRIVEGLE
jgi:hypothetical protein